MITSPVVFKLYRDTSISEFLCKMSDKRVRLMSFRLTDEVHRWLRRLAVNQKMTMSEVIFSVLEENKLADPENL